MTRNLQWPMNTSQRVGRGRFRCALARLVLATALVFAVAVPIGIAHAVPAQAAAEPSALCSALDRIRQLESPSEAIAAATEWSVVRKLTARFLAEAEDRIEVAAKLATGRLRSDIEIQARAASYLRAMLERSTSQEELRRAVRELEIPGAARAADRIDRYSLRVCGFGLR